MSPAAAAVDRRSHLGLKRLATHFAIGNDLQAGLFLEDDGLIHGPVLDLFEISRLEFPGSKFLLANQQFWRAEQATDHVGV
jgi:hypothetical protein